MPEVIDVQRLFGNDSGELDKNLHTYFVKTEEYNRICSGDIFLVSGKRGTGKSSIAKILKQNIANSILIRPTNLEIDSIREEAARISREIYEPKLTKIWLNTIYAEICKKLFKNISISDCKDTKYLIHYYDFINNCSSLNFIDSFLSCSRLLTNGEYNNHHLRTLFNNPEIQIIDREIQMVVGADKYFILFDNLDDDYDLDPIFTSILVNSLISATIQIVRNSTVLKPIIFIRNDIISFIAKMKNSFISQFRSNKVELRWNETNLLKVINARFSIYFEGNMPQPEYESHLTRYLKWVFPEEYTYQGNGGRIIKMPIGRYMIERSLMRPREIIQFARKIIEVNNYKYPLSSQDIRNSEDKYVAEFIEDLCTEYKNLYPNLNDVLELFRKGRFLRRNMGWNWKVVDLKKLFDQYFYLKDHNDKELRLSETVNVLYKIGFLRAVKIVSKTNDYGKLTTRRKYVTSSDEPDLNTDRVDEFDIHRLFRAQLKFEKRS